MGNRAMSFQIAKIILYSRAGEVRELKFEPGRFNILTGGSKTGKSAIIDIVDYCTGRSECNVADGVIRRYVSWYAVLFQLNGSQIFVSRRNPPVGERTNPDVYLLRAKVIATPPASSLTKNTTVDALEKFLGAAIGISENEHRPALPTRDPLEANFRHALLFSFQDQNDVDSKQRLFHRQGEDFISQAIKDTLPYFLGAIDEDRLLKQSQLDQARRQLRQLERQLRDAEAIDTSSYPRAQSLLDEAKQVGLIDERAVAATYEGVMTILQRVTREAQVQGGAVMGDGEDLLTELRAERQGLRSEVERVNAEIRSTRNFTLETGGYEREAKEQRARLSAVGLISADEHDPAVCPLCQSQLNNPPPTVAQIESSLRDLSDQLEAVEAENPRLQARLASLLGEEGTLQERLRDNQHRINARIQENEILRVQQESFVLQARAIGRISQYVEMASTGNAGSSLTKQVEVARSRVALLESELDPEAIREKLSAFMNIIGSYMNEYSEQLELEHRGSKLRLDIRNLTVVADTLDGPVSLFRMGSAENWVGYHVLAHLALHKWFRKKGRPVPGFIMFDQPSQAHYPAEKDAEGSIDVLNDEDQKAVHQLFRLMFEVAVELAGDLQIILLDHADLRDDWFQKAVVERWRKGVKLVPASWIEPTN
jgi:hypothetical protein